MHLKYMSNFFLRKRWFRVVFQVPDNMRLGDLHHHIKMILGIPSRTHPHTHTCAHTSTRTHTPVEESWVHQWQGTVALLYDSKTRNCFNRQAQYHTSSSVR